MLLAIPLSKRTGPLFRQVYARLRKAILSGALSSGDKLPSTRDLSEQLGISRTVVLAAYDQLLAEGFVVGRRGSGTYVSSAVSASVSAVSRNSVKLSLSRFGAAAAEAWSRVNYPQRPARRLRYDFAYGISDVENFPFAAWRRILMRCARRAPISELDYGPPGGNSALREAIGTHLRRSRAVLCDTSQVIVVNGSQQALDLIARVLIETGDSVALEDPSYQGTREVFRAAGARVIPVPVDRLGLDPSKLPDARLTVVTPSHQFPTGVILPLARRLALLQWAKRRNAIIIEDDYDGEFRYDGQSLDSLQGLDHEGRVIYIGTFSRTIFSTLRIGYLIAPRRLVRAFLSAKWLSDRQTATLEQQTLAEFISTGLYERHLRRVRRRNASRRDALLSAIRTHFKGRVEVTGFEAGGHIVLWPHHRISEESIIERAASQDVRVYGISGYSLKKTPRSGIILRYSRMNETEIREAIRRLSTAFSS